MPFARPALEELRLRIKQDLMSRLPGTDALLRRNNLSVIGDVEAGATHLLYGRLDWSFRQLFPDTADAEFLVKWASIWGVQRREASYATGTVQWDSAPAKSIATGAIVQRADGVRYVVTTGASESGAFISVPVEAITAGASGNAIAGVQMTLVTTVTGVSPLGLVTDPGIVGGADVESDSELLARLLYRIQSPPQGGTEADYIGWAMQVPGVTRAWAYGLENGPGTVVVRFMMDQVRAPTGIPTAGDAALVAAYIDPLRPVTATVSVVAPIPTPMNVTITVLATDTPEIRTAIIAELTDMLSRDAQPGGTIYQSQVSGAIADTPGVLYFDLTQPAAPVTAPAGHIQVLGTVTFPALD